MRPRLTNRLAVAALVLCTAAAPLTVDTTAGADGPDPVGSDPSRGERALEIASRVLSEGQGVAGGNVAPRGGPGVLMSRTVDATLALRALFVTRSTLDPADRRAAMDLFARPTDRARDPYGDGYRAPATRRCARHFCVHWVRRTTDAPASDAWARRSLRVMEQVWRHHVGKLGYRRPPRDGRRGGNGRFDVYLAELGRQGLFGYCAPERRVAGERRQASSYCVLDDDFARRQYGRAPRKTLRVTGAHEFLHAVQFGYDLREDPWLLESTATWVEERFADGVDDNRTYLRHGQLAKPAQSLDTFDGGGFAHYGNWLFWEFLSRRHGNRVVRSVWNRAAAGDGRRHSARALRRVLRNKGGLSRVLAAYASGNTSPGRTYPEGRAYSPAPTVREVRPSRSRPRRRWVARIDHLASKSIELRPGRSLAGRRWALRLRIDGPRRGTRPAAQVLIIRRDRLVRRAVPLDRAGRGVTRLGFSTRNTRRVLVTLANASTRYRCGRDTHFACRGAPRDERRRFTVTARAYRR